MSRIFVDYDETLVDLVSPTCDEINDCLRLTIECTPEEVSSYDYLYRAYGDVVLDFWRNPKAYDKIFPMPGAVDFLNELKKIYDEVIIITHCMNDEVYIGKQEHMEKHFGPTTSIMAKEKYKHMSAEDKLIEDNYSNLLDHYTYNGGGGILFNWENRYKYVSQYFDDIEKNDKLLYSTSYDHMLEELLK